MTYVDEFGQNLRYTLRALRRNRLLTCSVVLTFVIGVGLNAAIFSVVNGMVFRPRVLNNPSSFLQILTSYHRDGFDPWKTSLSDYRAFQAAKSVTSLEAWAVVHTTVDDGPQDNLAMLVSCGFFSLYGLETPAQGRVFRTGDCAGHSSVPVAVIGEELWRRSFSSDPAILGRKLLLNHHPYTIIGVAPAGFTGRLRGSGIWVPYSMEAQFFSGTDLFAHTTTSWLTVEGRLAPGYSKAQALSELSRLVPGVSVSLCDGSLIQHPSSGPTVKWVVPLILGAFGLLLLLACANVTMLLLSRAAARQKEMAIRLSLGASRGALVRMLLTEGVLLSSGAGILSLGLVIGVPTLFERVMWRAPHYVVEPDWSVFTYLTLLTLLVGVVTGLAPAAESLKLRLNGSLKGAESQFGFRTRETLIAGQVAASLVLLVGGALFARAEFSMVSSAPNFEIHQVLQVPLSTRAPFPGSIEVALKRIPNVSSVCFTSVPPLGGKTPDIVTLDGRQAVLNYVSPGCFQAMGIPIVRGSTESLVVSQSLAKTHPLGATILGQRISGIARDLSYLRPGTVDGPVIYRHRIKESLSDTVLVRVDGNPDTVAQTISRTLLSIDPNQTAVPFTLSSRIAETASRFAVIEQIVVLLGSVALVLAVVGIYGVAGFAVLRRTRELGIRLALGATTVDLLSAVLGPGLKPILIGLTFGVTFAAAGSFGLQQIFSSSPVSLDVGDPVPYAVASLTLVSAAVAAMLLPGLKVAFAIPADSLRED